MTHPASCLAVISFFASQQLFSLQAPAQVAINEFVASNGSVLADEDGDFESWIELYNAGDGPVDLEGFGLSDDSDNPFRWIFPAVTLDAGQFLLVWTSGKNRRDPHGPLHTTFGISSSGEPLLLTGPDGTIVEFFDPIALPRDHSFRRKPDGTGVWHYFADPTPGAANTTTTYTAWLEPPEFSRAGGFHTSEFLLELSSRDPGATILYTLDGSEPDPANLEGVTYEYRDRYPWGPPLQGMITTHVYGAPIEIRDRTGDPNRLAAIPTTANSEYPPNYIPDQPVFKGTIVRARAFRDDALPSPIVTHSYFVSQDGSDRYTLPVLSVVAPEDRLFGYDRGIYVAGEGYDTWHGEGTRPPGWPDSHYYQRGRGWEAPGHLEIFLHGEERVHAQNLGFRIHGGSSRTQPLKSLRLYSRRDYDPDGRMNYPFFDDLVDIYGRPIRSFNRLILRQAGQDSMNARFRDALAQAALRPLGLNDQRHLPVIHFINGEFWGHMNVRERVDRFYIEGRHLIDPDDVAIINMDILDSDGNYGGAVLAEGTEADLQDYLDLVAYAADHDLAEQEHFDHVGERLDVESFLISQMAQIYIANRDWPHNNNDSWRKRSPDRRPGAHPTHDGRWRWVFADLDFAFNWGRGSELHNHRTLEWATRDSSWGENPARVDSTLLLRNMLENPAFRARFINAFADHMNTTLQPHRVLQLIEEFNAVIGPYRDGEHRERWPNMGSPFIDLMKQFIDQRPHAMSSQLRDYFGLGQPVNVTLDVSDQQRGTLQINTIRLDHDTPGLPDPARPFPFEGVYFEGHPIEVTALPRPGYRFAGWVEFPEHAESTITLTPQSGLTLTAQFARGMPDLLIAYWSFNDTSGLLHPDFAWNSAHLAVAPGPETGVTDGGGNGFTGANARLGESPGRHLRVNNPLGAEIVLQLPTEGFENPVLSYETRRSGSGAAHQLIEYSLDGNAWSEFAQIIIFNEDPIVHTFDFGVIDGASDNPDFRVRISFGRGRGGWAGNNRIDNIVLNGREIGVGSIFEQSDPTLNFGYGWKWNELGYLYDRHFPYVYRVDPEAWIYVIGDDESSYYFWSFEGEHWAWTGSGVYPAYYVLTGADAGAWREL